jgi:hypothetical protein
VPRRLWFGLALICAFGSIYAGLFGAPRLQYTLIGLAIVALLAALRSPQPPDAQPPEGYRDAQGE